MAASPKKPPSVTILSLHQWDEQHFYKYFGFHLDSTPRIPPTLGREKKRKPDLQTNDASG
jgi:hypothetical protein